MCAKYYKQTNYQKKYQELLAGELTFEQFMEFVNGVYLAGRGIGELVGQSEALRRVNEEMAKKG